MYQNMTREEMIQRLYEGNFTTGELERQLIAKLFEQCCGGGGSGSSGGGAFVVELEPVDNKKKFNKTAKEVFDACKTSNVIFMETTTETDPDFGVMTVTEIYSLAGIKHYTAGSNSTYAFVLIGPDVQDIRSYYVGFGDNDYPITSGK